MPRTARRISCLAAFAIACGTGCSLNVPIGGRLGSFRYPRADTRPVEHGFCGWDIKLPRRGARVGFEARVVGAMGGEESDYITTSAGARWFWPTSSKTTGEQDIGPFVGLGIAHVNMRLETWDGSVSGRDQSLGGYVSCGVAEVGGIYPVSIEFRYTFATELDLLGGTMDANGFAFVLDVGFSN